LEPPRIGRNSFTARPLSVMREPKHRRTRPPIEAVPPTIAHGERYSDVGNARRLVRLFGDSIRWVPQVGWFWFDGTRWRRDVDGEMMRRAKAVTQAIIDGSRYFPTDARNEAVKFALRSEQAPRLTAMIELAKSADGIAVPYSRFDADPWLVGVERGAVDLRTGTFLVPPANAYLSRRLCTEYNPHAQCPTWCAFLDRITAGDISLIDFLQRAIGYTLTGNASEQVIFVLHGPGANGKSVLLRVIRELAGEYGADAAIETFVDRARRESSNDLARLAHLRFVCASELDEERPLAESPIKAVTGGEAISARFLYGEYFEFEPTFKVWIACNHKPRISGDDHGIWRRIRLTPLRVPIPPEEQDRDLQAKLRRELPGILNWAIVGALAWQRDGMGPPAAVTAATQAYRDGSDSIGEWIRQRCVIEPGAAIQAMPLYVDYAKYIEERGGRPLSMKRWAQRMIDRGFEKNEGRVITYRGIALCDLATIGDHYSGTSSYLPARGDLPEEGREGRNGRSVGVPDSNEPPSALGSEGGR
jgi:putative DNA primase/helicase